MHIFWVGGELPFFHALQKRHLKKKKKEIYGILSFPTHDLTKT